MTRERGKFTEQYSKCGCSAEAIYEDLLGYCEKHGNEWKVRYGPRGGAYYNKADASRRATGAAGGEGVR